MPRRAKALEIGFAALLAATAAQGAATLPNASEPSVTYDHVTLIDGVAASARPDMAIVLRGERIAGLVPASTVKAGPNVVDMHGAFALPGLINTHVHLATSPGLAYPEAILRRDLYSGITAVRDMAGDTRELGYLSRATQIGETEGPDIVYAALMAGPEFFKDPRTVESTRGRVPGETPWMRVVTPVTDLRLAVAEAKGTGAGAIKIYADLAAPLVAAITAEAHRQHLLVWAHAAVFPASPMEVVDAGADVVSHACMLGYQASRSMPAAYHNRAPVDADRILRGNPALDALLADIKRRGTILDATLYVYKELDGTKGAGPPPYCTLKLAQIITAQAYRAGIPISAGTDGETGWRDAWPALSDELALLEQAGLSPMDALRAATAIAARTIGEERERGTLEKGKFADIVFLAKNPLDDIANIKSVTMTVKRGKQYPRSAYRPISRDEARGEDE
ncbi:MAG: amidohydrolase family protein [Alphaproteobacteria bacterium]|nr:amidohydrolase family protein [Alphaproteobacteria bacterium]MBV9692910.1 amidohydrolase family protein [Alphaproteobacteria bacterium]